MKRVCPCSTASMAGRARGSIFTNHCLESSGSSTVSQRWHRPSGRTCGFDPRSSPFSASRRFTSLRAANRSRPATGPAAAVIFPSRPMTVIISSRWRLPTSKSLKSWAGVTLTAPVPKAGSTRMASPMMGISRSTSGWRTFLPMSAL